MGMMMSVSVSVRMIVRVVVAMRHGCLRIERRLQRGHLGAEPAQHLLQHVVSADADAKPIDLHVGVAIAKMPGEADEFAW